MNHVEKVSESTLPIYAVKCKKSWLIFSSTDEIQGVGERADNRLADLEAKGLEDFSCTDHLSYSIGCVRDICDDLKLTRGRVIDSRPSRPAIVIQKV